MDATHQALLDELYASFGSPFVNWLFAIDGSSPLDTAQAAAITAFHTRISDAEVPSEIPPSLRLRAAVAGEPAKVLNEIRSSLEPEQTSSDTFESDDATLDELRAWATHNYGLMLASTWSPLVASPFDQASQNLQRAVAEDSQLPFDSASQPFDWITLTSSTGTGGGIQLASLGPAIVRAAFEWATTHGVFPSLPQLLDELPARLDAARSVLAGAESTALGLAGFTGVLLPVGTRLVLPWGCLRAAEEAEHQFWPIGQMSSGRLAVQNDDGTTTVIRDAGDVVLEAEVRYTAKLHPNSTTPPAPSDLSSQQHLQEIIDRVRLAYLLAWEGAEPPVVVPTWQRIVEPLELIRTLGRRELALALPRTPTQLTQEQCEAWRKWIIKLDSVPIDCLGPAIPKLLRATAERHDPVDALIDAVIAWEAIFGDRAELTMRVSICLARLLETAPKDREKVYLRAKSIYSLRSSIVHGAHESTQMNKVIEGRRDAISMALRALRTLIDDRPELLELTSRVRSETVMLD